MTTTYAIKEILDQAATAGQSVKVQGWVRTRRDSKAGISFIALSDGSCFATLQIVVPNTLDNYQSDVLNITTGCSIIVTGDVVESPGGNQAIEIAASSIEVVGWVENPESYPMAAKRHSMEHLREHTHLRMRTNIIGAVTRIRHGAAQAIHRYFSDHGFYWINTPIITGCDCEGGGDLFRVSTLDTMNIDKTSQGNANHHKEFFGQPAYLTNSGQLNVEAYCLAMSKVYTFGPTFRAENSNTTRHLAEFWMIEPEIAFADLNDDIKLAESLMKYVCKDVLDNYADDMQFFNQWVDKECIQRIEKMLSDGFERIDYTDAITQLIAAKHTFEHPVVWGIDLQTEHERYLTDVIFNKPVVVCNYPKDIKAFYMRLNDDNKTVAAMDILLPGVGEIVGGAQREERLDVLQTRIKDCGLNAEEYDWYTDLRRYGSVPHAGFGLGFERLIRYITGIANVRDIAPFPRVPNYMPPNKPPADPE